MEAGKAIKGRIFLFGLRDYAELYSLIARLTGESLSATPVDHG